MIGGSTWAFITPHHYRRRCHQQHQERIGECHGGFTIIRGFNGAAATDNNDDSKR